VIQLRSDLVPAAHVETLPDEPEVLREGLEGARLVPQLELVNLVGVAVAGLRVLDDDLEGRKARALVVVEVLNGFQVPVVIEERPDVRERDAAILLETGPRSRRCGKRGRAICGPAGGTCIGEDAGI
jgi:hypothetical protein